MKKLWMHLAMSLALTGAVACGDDSGDDDDDDDDDVSNLPVAQVGENEDEDTVIDPASAMPANLGCLGEARTVGDTDVTVSLELADGLNRAEKISNAPIDLYLDNTYQATFTADVETNGSGIATFMAREGQLFGFRFVPDGETRPIGYAESIQYNAVASAGMAFEASGATISTLNLLPLTVGGQQVSAGNGIISAAFEDCDGNDVYGVEVAFFRGSDGLRFQDSPTLAIRYFDGVGDGSPTTGRIFTHVDGRYAAINLPGNADTLIGIYGRACMDGETLAACEARNPPEQLLSCERVFTIAAASTDAPNVTILTSRPLRPETASLACPASL